MMSVVKPVHLKNNNCLEDTLATLINHLGYNYELLYAYKWNFIYYPHKNIVNFRIGSRIDPGWNANWLALKNMYGFTIKRYSNLSNKDFLNLLNENFRLERPPIVLNIDSFNVPWSKAYRKFHMQHFCLIVGMCDNDIICLDPFFDDEIKIIESSNIIRNSYSLFLVSQAKELHIDTKKIIDSLISSYIKINPNGMSTNASMYKFAEDFKNDFDFERDYLLNGKGLSPISIQMENVANGRQSIALLIHRIYHYSNVEDLVEIMNMFEDSYKMWHNVEVSIRNFDRLEKSNDYICDCIQEIASYESLLFQSFKKVESKNSERFNMKIYRVR
jgi:hypothetical protein